MSHMIYSQLCALEVQQNIETCWGDSFFCSTNYNFSGYPQITNDSIRTEQGPRIHSPCCKSDPTHMFIFFCFYKLKGCKNETRVVKFRVKQRRPIRNNVLDGLRCYGGSWLKWIFGAILLGIRSRVAMNWLNIYGSHEFVPTRMVWL